MTLINAVNCPGCGAELGEWEKENVAPQILPQPNDVGFCELCQTPFMFTGALGTAGTRRVTEEDIARMDPGVREILIRFMREG